VANLYTYIDDPDTMHLFLYYLNKTKMTRVHDLPSLRLNSTCYYRAAENMLSESHLIASWGPTMSAIFPELKLEFLTIHPSEQTHSTFFPRHGHNIRLDLSLLEASNEGD